MSRHICKLPCPVCGSSKGLNIFEEDGVRTGYCFSPKHDESTKYFSTKALAEIPESDVIYEEKEPKDISWVDELQVFDNPDRGLKRGAYGHFGIKHGVSRQDGRTITETYYPRLDDTNCVSAWKVRTHNPKDFYVLGRVRNALPCGWKQALEIGGYNLYITEGEEDMVAVYTAWMREKKQKVAVISLNQGAESVIKTLQPILKDITDKWKQVVFLPDQDDAGDKAVRDIRALFPSDYIVKIAKYTEKDSNEMVKQGKEKELVSACYNAGTPLSMGILAPDYDMFEELKKPLEFGLSYPWPSLTKHTRGQRKGEVLYWGAPPKGGKTTLVNHLAEWNIREHNQKVLIISPESPPKGTLRRLSGSIVNKVFHDPNIEVNPEDVDRAREIIGDKLHIFDKWQTPNWADTRQLIKEEVLSQGIESVYIDPITNFSIGMSGSERNDFLITMTRELAEDANNYGFTAHVFCHYNKAPKGDKQWSQGRIPTSDDFAGSGAMAQACHMAIGLQVWKLTEDEDKEYLNSQRVLHILEDREFGVVEAIPLRWVASQGRLKEVQDERD